MMKFGEWLWMKAKKKGKEWMHMLKLSVKTRHFWLFLSFVIITAEFFGGIISAELWVLLQSAWLIVWILSSLYDEYKKEMMGADNRVQR